MISRRSPVIQAMGSVFDTFSSSMASFRKRMIGYEKSVQQLDSGLKKFEAKQISGERIISKPNAVLQIKVMEIPQEIKAAISRSLQAGRDSVSRRKKHDQ